jgi:hypothetical protein
MISGTDRRKHMSNVESLIQERQANKQLIPKKWTHASYAKSASHQS